MQDALSKVAGVSEVVSVSMDTNTAVVKVAKGKVATEALVKAIESVEGRSFSAAPIEKVTLSVTGMVCDACPSKVQDALSKVAGVSEVVSVSTDTNTAVVKVPRGKVATDVLVKAIESIEGRSFSAAPIEKVTLSVTGMVCDACPSKVQDALSKVAGVSEVVSVSTDTNTAVVKVPRGKVATDVLVKAIESIEGRSFSAAPIEKVTLSVTGMVCDACPSKVQDALSKVAGVSEVVSVSTDTNTAVVKIAQGKVTTEALIKAIAAIEGGSFKAQVAH